MTPGQVASEPALTRRFAFNLRTFIWLSVIFGILVSGYLSYVKLADEKILCAATETLDCDAVQSSVYSQFMGIPIAYLGLAMYLGIAALLLLEKRIPFLAENGKLLLFGITLFAWMYSMYLVYLQVAVLGKLCQWCLMHEINITVLFGLMSYQLWRFLGGGEKAKR